MMIISELFIYDQADSLFKQILLKSKVMQGRYFIISSGSKLGELQVDQKFPCTLCVAPRSTAIAPEYTRQSFSFELYFLTRQGVTGQNQIKQSNNDNLTSLHPAWYDWKDMNECALNFIRILRGVLSKKMIGDVPLRGLLCIDSNAAPSILRITNSGQDGSNGVKMTLSMILSNGCDNDDYAGITLDDITLPASLNPHPLHRH